jgi:hypothetical protein
MITEKCTGGESMSDIPGRHAADCGSALSPCVQLKLMEINRMELDLKLLRHLLSKRAADIEKIVAGTGYLPKTVIGVGTFLLDNEGDLDLLTAKQRVVFEKFLQPLL